MQLVELQEAWRRLEQAGVAVFALSYDSVETLAGFAEKHGITYPLLSDVGSHTIRALGLLNEKHLVEQHTFYGIRTRDDQIGVAYPGTFVLDESGVVKEKHFEQSYRVRPTARIFEEFALGRSEPGASSEAPHADAPGVEVRAWTDAPTYRPYQQVRLHVQLSVAPDMHVFVSPVADGYTPVSLQVHALDGLSVGEPEMPTPTPFTLEGLDEQFLVYEGTTRGVIPLQFAKNLGPSVITLGVRYQACTQTECFPPAELLVAVPLTGLDLIRD